MSALALQAMIELNEVVDAATAGAQSYSEALKLSLNAIIPLGDRQLFLASEPVENDPAIAAAHRRDMDELRHAIEAARGEGLFAPDVPTGWIAQAYEALIYAAWTMVRDGDATPRQAADFAWRTLTSGLTGPTRSAGTKG